MVIINTNNNIRIGVLALQGAFREHCRCIEKLGIQAVQIRLPEELKEVDGLIIPGGESTTMYKLMDKYCFKDALIEFNKLGKPIYGTCAGLIVLAKYVVKWCSYLGFIDIKVARNYYGRQVDSFEQSVELKFDKSKKFNAIFIRAPRILDKGPGVEILAAIEDNIILARENNILVSSFHPELQEDLRIHEYFLNMIEINKKEE